jgi:hypothetical protein
MSFIPRQVKPPARIAVTCKLPQQVASLLKCYAEFLDSSQEYVVTETLQLAFRKDREFQAWLTTTHPEMATVLGEGSSVTREPSNPSPTRVHAGRTAASRLTTTATSQNSASSPTTSREHGRS